jgi:hypothetical protein
MAGILRINIESDWHDWRTKMSKELSPAADDIYREIFTDLSMPLDEFTEYINCNKEQAMARYDWKEGIDCILNFKDGTKATLQEKFLDYYISTATFEETKSSGEKGAWYYCTAQYYFVGYARLYKTESVKEFQDWVLIDLPALHRCDAKHNVLWHFNQNSKDGRKAKFRYLPFEDVPDNALVSSFNSVRF